MSEHAQPQETPLSRAAHTAQWLGLFIGPILALAVYRWTESTAGLSVEGRRVIAVAVLMASWWLSEAIPLSATALLPVALLPLLGVGTVKQAAAPYADDILFLFMGGFIIGEAIQRSGLHRRFALLTLLGVGTTPARMVGGVMLATAMISMWVSNTATTLMMLPIGVSIVALVEARAASGGSPDGWDQQAVRRFGIAIVLGIAYAASIGGITTPVGTPPNLAMLNYLRNSMGLDIDFVRWMTLGVPLVAVFLPASWLLLTRVMHPVRAGRVPGGRAMIAAEVKALGRLTRPEWVTLAVFGLAAAAWVARGLVARKSDVPGIVGQVSRAFQPVSDAGIAIIAALLLFLVPVRLHPRTAVVRWRDVERLPWGILLLFGGGLSIADAMGRTGVDAFLGSMFGGLAGVPLVVLIVAIVAAVTFVGELSSNVAVVTALMPVLAAAGRGMGMDPVPLMLAATLGSSCGFMLPVATPPNALAYATGRVTQAQMIRSGFLLDLVGIAVVTAVVTVAARAGWIGAMVTGR